MERKRNITKSGAISSSNQKGKASTDDAKPRNRASAKPKKRKINLLKSDTALGSPQEKRGLKQTRGQEKNGQNSSNLTSRSGAALRGQHVNVKTGRYRKHSSTLWLDRQLNDPYVARAKAEGFRSRAAFKLVELNDKFDFLKPGVRIVDLGCAPGGWCQVAARAGAGRIIGIDYLEMPAVEGTDFLQLDFLDPAAPDQLKVALGGKADLVLSDMAAPTTGHRPTDHLRVVALAEAALDFSIDVLSNNGIFICKVFQGGAEGDLLKRLRQKFSSVKHAKPKASRPESPEKYVVAIGFNNC